MYTSLAVGKYSSTISVSFRFLHVAEESQVMNLLQKRDEWGKRCVPRLWDSLTSYLDKPWVWTCCHWLGSTCMKCMPRLVSHRLLLKGAEKQSTCKLVASGSSTLYSLNHARRGWTHAILKNTIWKNLNSSLEPEKDTNLAPQLFLFGACTKHDHNLMQFGFSPGHKLHEVGYFIIFPINKYQLV